MTLSDEEPSRGVGLAASESWRAPPAPASQAGAVVLADHLTKRFGDVLAVDDLSFALQPGTVTGFLGPNGARKTTTLRMLLHLVQPTSGWALVFGGRYRTSSGGRAPGRGGAGGGRLPSRPLGARPSVVLARARARPARGRRSFTPRAGTGRLEARGGGVRLGRADRAAGRRVGSHCCTEVAAAARLAALLGNPELLILDEPRTASIPRAMRWLRDFLRGFAAEGKAVLVSSHVLAEVAQTVDQVVIINKAGSSPSRRSRS